MEMEKKQQSGQQYVTQRTQIVDQSSITTNLHRRQQPASSSIRCTQAASSKQQCKIIIAQQQQKAANPCQTKQEEAKQPRLHTINHPPRRHKVHRPTFHQRKQKREQPIKTPSSSSSSPSELRFSLLFTTQLQLFRAHPVLPATTIRLKTIKQSINLLFCGSFICRST